MIFEGGENVPNAYKSLQPSPDNSLECFQSIKTGKIMKNRKK